MNDYTAEEMLKEPCIEKINENAPRILRASIYCRDFHELVKLLNDELNSRYGILQMTYDKYNRSEDIGAVVIGYTGSTAAGCGCFKIYDTDTVEIKRMIVRPEFRGSGIAGMILREAENWAIEKGFSKAVLETGIKQPEALRFYEKMGYRRTENYGQYAGNSNSICMSKMLYFEKT